MTKEERARRSFEYAVRQASRCRHESYQVSCYSCVTRPRCDIQERIERAKSILHSVAEPDVHYAVQLPVYCYMDQEYFVDFRLRELRGVSNPHQRFPFCFITDPEMKAQLRGLRAEFSTPCYMPELDD